MKPIWIVGGGAVGSLLVANLRLSREDRPPIRFVVRNPDYRQRLTQGIEVRSLAGEALGTLRLSPEELVAQLPDPPFLTELVVVAVRAYQVAEVRSRLGGMARDALFVFNGMVEPPPRLVGVLSAGASLRDDHLAISTSGELEVCFEGGAGDSPSLSPLLSGPYLTVYEVGSRAPQYLKLALNATVNPLAALVGQPNRLVLEEPLVGVARKVMEEVAGLYQKLVPQYAFTFEELWEELSDLVERTAENFCSTLMDLRLGRRTEIEFISGWLVEQGARLGVDLPLNRRLTALVLSFPARGGRFFTPEELTRELGLR